MLPRSIPLTPPQPSADAMAPPISAPRMPIRIVMKNPPGSSPGISSFAITPAINPKMIHARMPIRAPFFHLRRRQRLPPECKTGAMQGPRLRRSENKQSKEQGAEREPIEHIRHHADAGQGLQEEVDAKKCHDARKQRADRERRPVDRGFEPDQLSRFERRSQSGHGDGEEKRKAGGAFPREAEQHPGRDRDSRARRARNERD